jgi:glutamyl-Q tRNA(Asp) synthetase
MTYRTRFAPSPTGHLHLGHAASALAVWAAAEAQNGDVLLRLEDIDQTRCKPEFEASILEDLTWLGLNWQGEVRRQSDHFPDYAQVLDQLRARDLLYRCFRTRKDVLAEIGRAPHGAAKVFIGSPLNPNEETERLAVGEPFAWRLSLSRAREALGKEYETLGYEELGEAGAGFVKARPDLHGDVVLARKDTPTSYHLAVTHDDALQGVTHIVRGEDLRESTHIHVLIQALMKWPRPIYTHHRLMTDAAGRRYAKRDKSMTLRTMRQAGETAADIRARVGPL